MLKQVDWLLRFQQLVIIVLHLALLRWMLFVLSEAGVLTTGQVLGHFLGMAVYGAALIRGCAAWGKRRYRIEQQRR